MRIEMTSRNERILYFDVLNILACLAVIFLHCNGIVHTYTNERYWATSLIFEVIFYWAVPVFIMLSGANLLKYREKYSTLEFFKKRVVKIIIPWLFWSIVVYIYKNRSFEFISFIQSFLNCKIESIYWFFPLILYLYCLIPIFSILVQKKETKNILIGIVIFIFIFQSLLVPLSTIFKFSYPTVFLFFNSQTPYIIFLILGYLLHTTEISKKYRIIIYLLAIGSLLLRYTYTYFMSTSNGVLNRDLFSYTGFYSVFLATAVFLLFKKLPLNKIFLKLHISPKLITKISSYSFGVYLIHMLLKTILTNKFGLNIYSIWYRTLGAIGLYLLCILIVWGIKKIPVVKHIVP